MTTQHTPGPWVIVRDTPTSLHLHKNDGLLISRIARLDSQTLCEEHGGTTEANARLIAAAPDLLSFAQSALEALQGVEWNPMYSQSKILDECRAAIARATGGAA